jgi:hypothetical protein
MLMQYLLSPGRTLVSILYRILPVPNALREGDLNAQYFLGSVLVLSVLVFLILRLASRLSLSKLFLRHFAGVAGIAAFPLAERYSGWLRPDARYWLPFEILTALILTVLYQFGYLRRNSALMLFLLTAHFVFWGWMMGPDYFWAVYPILGFAASLMWGVYVQESPGGVAHPPEPE